MTTLRLVSARSDDLGRYIDLLEEIADWLEARGIKQWRRGNFRLSAGVLDALVVDPAWRRRGIGTLLARAVEAWAIGSGAPWVEVNVYEVNADARRFYKALGYLPLSTKLRKPGGATSLTTGCRLGPSPDTSD